MVKYVELTKNIKIGVVALLALVVLIGAFMLFAQPKNDALANDEFEISATNEYQAKGGLRVLCTGYSWNKNPLGQDTCVKRSERVIKGKTTCIATPVDNSFCKPRVQANSTPQPVPQVLPGEPVNDQEFPYVEVINNESYVPSIRTLQNVGEVVFRDEIHGSYYRDPRENAAPGTFSRLIFFPPFTLNCGRLIKFYASGQTDYGTLYINAAGNGQVIRGLTFTSSCDFNYRLYREESCNLPVNRTVDGQNVTVNESVVVNATYSEASFAGFNITSQNTFSFETINPDGSRTPIQGVSGNKIFVNTQPRTYDVFVSSRCSAPFSIPRPGTRINDGVAFRVYNGDVEVAVINAPAVATAQIR